MCETVNNGEKVCGLSLQTGRSKGFGFIQFEDEDVARIAVESMNNYIMFKRALKGKIQFTVYNDSFSLFLNLVVFIVFLKIEAEVLDPEKVHDNIFRGFSGAFMQRKERNVRNNVTEYNSSSGPNKKSRRAAAKAAKRKRDLAQLGFAVS